MIPQNQKAPRNPRVLIIGGGFAGLACATELAETEVQITLADRHNYHLFQPLLYQVATAVLSPADIATPIRHLLRHQQNARVVLAELVGIDPGQRQARFKGGVVPYDYLVLATGASHYYFGHDDWAPLAPGLKSVDDALEIRRRVLLAYEAAEWEADAEARQAKLTFVVVGGGPTGVELAGALKEIAAQTIPRDFRNIDTTTARILLVEAGPCLLAAMPEKLQRRALHDLEAMGVQVRLNSRVTQIREGSLNIGEEELPAENIIWAAGVHGSKVAATLGCDLDREGRVRVAPDLSVPGHPEVFVVGDLAHVLDPHTGQPVPGVAPAAIQMGRFVAGLIRRELESPSPLPARSSFLYRDKGSLATIGRNRAVACVAGHQFGGFFAWFLWGVVHIIPLVGFRNRLAVVISWLWSYFSLSKHARLITGRPKMKVKQVLGIIEEQEDTKEE